MGRDSEEIRIERVEPVVAQVEGKVLLDQLTLSLLKWTNSINGIT